MKIEKNKIILGNCINVLRKIDDKVDLIVTDPPQYKLINPNIKFKTRTDFVRNVNFDLFDSYNDFYNFTNSWIKLCSKLMKKDSTMYISYAEAYSNDLINICKKYGLKYFDTFYWHKTNPMPQVRKRNFLSSVETTLIFTKGNYTFNFLKQNEMHDFMELPLCMGKERLKNKERRTLHPTQKPLKLIKHFVKISSNVNDNVLDPFSGTGTTNVACKLLNRNGLGIEINEEYHFASVERLNKINTTKSSVLGWLK